MNKRTRATASDFDPEVMQLFDQYVHGVIDRRAFLARAGRFAAGAAGALGLLAALSPQFAAARQVAPEDPRIAVSHLEFNSPQGNGKGRGYLVRPAAATTALPVVMVVHENRGLNPHIEDVARRMALEGFIAFAPDALFTLGGYPGDEDAARTLFAKLDPRKAREDFVAAAHMLHGLEGASGRLGVVGFCYGGAIANMLATRLPDLAAAAPFYGSAPALEDVGCIGAELLVVLAESDERVNATWPAYKAALEEAGVRHSLLQPAGTQHGFHNDTTPRHDADAAAQAWRLTVELFNRRLLAPDGAAPPA